MGEERLDIGASIGRYQEWKSTKSVQFPPLVKTDSHRFELGDDLYRFGRLQCLYSYSVNMVSDLSLEEERRAWMGDALYGEGVSEGY